MVSETKVSVNRDASKAQAMKLPTPVRWPESAVSFLLIGGQDNFRRGSFVIQDSVKFLTSSNIVGIKLSDCKRSSR